MNDGPALLYVAHQLDAHVIAGWRALCDSCVDRGYHPVFLYDDSRHDFAEAPEMAGGGRYLFTYAQLKREFPFRTYDPQRPVDQGNATFPILAFFRERPNHTSYWRVEYDVVFDGDWFDFFSAFAENDADLLTTTLYGPAIRPDWGWWPTLGKPWHDHRRLRRLRAFMPIARLSQIACVTLDRAYRKGWFGHDEAAVPSILHSHRLKLEDLGGAGAFTPPAGFDRFYTNTPAARGLAPGTFVCPPHLPRLDERPGKLYHPVKDRLEWLRLRDVARA